MIVNKTSSICLAFFFYMERGAPPRAKRRSENSGKKKDMFRLTKFWSTQGQEIMETCHAGGNLVRSRSLSP